MRIIDWSSDVCSSDFRAALEGRGARDEHVGTRRYGKRRGARVDAAVDLEPDVAARFLDHLPHRLDLPELALNEAMAAKAGIDAHNKHQVDVVEQIVEHLRRGRSEEHTSELHSL